MDKIAEEARRRVSQMQSAAKPEKNEPAEPAEPKSQDPLAGLFKDKEKLLVLLLIMLLSQESSNTELVLALLYIII